MRTNIGDLRHRGTACMANSMNHLQQPSSHCNTVLVFLFLFLSFGIHEVGLDVCPAQRIQYFRSARRKRGCSCGCKTREAANPAINNKHTHATINSNDNDACTSTQYLYKCQHAVIISHSSTFFHLCPSLANSFATVQLEHYSICFICSSRPQDNDLKT